LRSPGKDSKQPQIDTDNHRFCFAEEDEDKAEKEKSARKALSDFTARLSCPAP
jgi:hypothetical protein